jgi:flagellar hook-associated protein 3 FlgL
MRITFSQAFEDGLRDIARVGEQLSDAQRRVSSGRRINAPSDDPAGTAAAIGEHAGLATVDSYVRATDAASSRLAVVDAALSDIVNLLTAAKVTATAARGSGRSVTQLSALSTEILGLRDGLMGDINTRFGGTYLFGGASATTAPYATVAGSISGYQGDSVTQSIDVSDGRAVQVSFDGGEIFQGTDSQHVLDLLTDLATAISAGDSAGIQTGLDGLDRAFDRALFAQTRVGIAQRMLDDTRPQLDSTRLGSLARVSATEDANMAEAISDLTRAKTAQESALASFATLGQLSLLDYLR